MPWVWSFDIWEIHSFLIFIGEGQIFNLLKIVLRDIVQAVSIAM